MNNMIEFAKTNRTTTYFRNYAFAQIMLAYRIMEYLAPDNNFPPKVDTLIKNLLLQKAFSEAYEHIHNELLHNNFNLDTGSSCGNELLKSQAIELMEYLLPIYEKGCKDVKEKRKIELLKKLHELDKDN